MNAKEAIAKVLEQRSGISSITAEILHGPFEEAIESLLEQNDSPTPAPRIARTLTAKDQAECDAHIRKINLRKFFPGPETVIDGGDLDLTLATSAKPASIFDLAMQNLEAQRQQHDRELRATNTRATIPSPHSLAKTPSTNSNDGELRREIHPEDGTIWLVRYVDGRPVGGRRVAA
jgi:hypothetical protein